MATDDETGFAKGCLIAAPISLMLWAAVLILLNGCDAPDGYSFEHKEFERKQPAITIVTHPRVADLRSMAPPAARAEQGAELMAWSIIRKEGCEVHVVDPAKSYQPEWIGHEVAHCIWGRFHK